MLQSNNRHRARAPHGSQLSGVAQQSFAGAQHAERSVKRPSRLQHCAQPLVHANVDIASAIKNTFFIETVSLKCMLDGFAVLSTPNKLVFRPVTNLHWQPR
jgi:hypothetical protein